MSWFLGVDIGTTAVKAAVFDDTGHVRASAREAYNYVTPAPSIVEIEPETYWRAFCVAVHRAADESGQRDLIVALCVATQGETLVAVDRHGDPTRAAIVWLDSRATSEAQHIEDQLGAVTIFNRTGQPSVVPTWPACKVLWIRSQEPDVFAATSKFLLLEDYILLRLTATTVSDRCLQSSSLLLDIHEGRWWQPMLDVIGLAADRLPALVDSGNTVGRLTADAARATGLGPHTVAVAGGLDQAVAAVGAGNIAPGIVTETTGGALAVVATLDRPVFDGKRRIPCHVHARVGSYCLMAWGQTAGLGLEWVVDNFFRLDVPASHQVTRDYKRVDEAALSVAAGSDGLIVLPHFAGAACPELNPAARAVFFGVTLRHSRGHFARALMEAVAYMLRANLDVVEKLAGPVRDLRSTGGGANSDVWLQIKADALQKPIISMEAIEAACLGAAMLAAVAIGRFENLDQAVTSMVRLRKHYEPNRARRQIYSDGYHQYSELYARLVPMFKEK